MALGTLTLFRNSSSDVPSQEGPDYRGRYMVETWKFQGADGVSGTDKITCKFINKILFATGFNEDIYGSNTIYTVDNTQFPPVLVPKNVAAGDSGIITIYGY